MAVVPAKRFSLSSPQPASTAGSTLNLKKRVIACLNKLSDRDTLAVAVAELESIACTLSHDTFSTFLSCIHNTDSSSKSLVRKQCVHLLTVLSHFHGDALSPFLSKMISTVLRRLRDPDSAVRSACVDAIAAMSSRITKPPFLTGFLKPFMETLTQEQDANSQMGAALCLAAAIESAPEPDVEALKKSALPRLGKLLKNEVCKAKAALLVLIGSVVGVGGASNHVVLNWLVPCLVEFLSNEDWTVRKAAAEALGKVALVERDLASQHKELCMSSLQNRRFDKIKVVRDTMNRAMEMWKEVTDSTKDDSAPATPARYSDGPDYGKEQRSVKSSVDSSLKSAQPRKIISTNKPLPCEVSFVSTAKRKSFRKSKDKKLNSVISRELDHELFDRKFETPDSNSFPLNMKREDDIKRCGLEVSKPCLSQNCENPRTEARRALFSKKSDEKVHKSGGLRSGFRVVPCCEDDIPHSQFMLDNNVNEACENPQDVETLSLIREQLNQIENQQSNLLNLVQRFIGSSQSGMNSLETRVRGLETALDEISHDLAVSRGRLSKTDAAEDMCCKLPGSEFLSSKFWKKTEGRCSTPRLYSRNKLSPDAVHDMADKEGGVEMFTLKDNKFRHHGVGLYVNPLADGRSDSKDHLRQRSCKMPKDIVQGTERTLGYNTSKHDGILLAASRN
ncbi:TORTIFOLIA1-like protein 4 [Neltuma alba]|uniref:TORTIFOLIA1-like protein 4 n=1 Tax=Neltuma alba TaxID=207710 RepID=UPI0010A4A84C|nr:TORTIFOLIA1-like protein 4 [Prosopis alba]XP_028767615.1 TORTIFOLIA1-like protein 4 [Prosopis alba]